MILKKLLDDFVKKFTPSKTCCERGENFKINEPCLSVVQKRKEKKNKAT